MKRELVIILVAISCIAGLSIKSCRMEREKSKLISQYNKTFLDGALEIKKWKDEAGRQHTEAQNQIVDNLILEEKVSDLSQQLSVKPKQIQSHTVATSETKLKVRVDTVYEDSYVFIEKLKNDTIKLKLYDTLSYTRYWKRKWFLAPRRYYIDLSNTNPYVNITGLKSIEATPKVHRFILGPSIIYTPFSNKVNFGVSLMYSPLSIKF